MVLAEKLQARLKDELGLDIYNKVIYMKYIITALIILGLYSTGATADCLDKKNVNFMPVGIATELCFTSEVLKLKLGSARNFIYEIEVDDNISPSYKEKGIKSVVTLRPAESKN
jgi:hypothetical protein